MIDLKKIWNKTIEWPWCHMGLTAWCLFWMCRFFYLAAFIYFLLETIKIFKQK